MDNRQIFLGVATLILGFLVGYFASSASSYPMMREQGGMHASIDQHFIEQMIPHHEGAIAMATIALTKSTREDVLSLSRGIIEAQTKEIADMKKWYREWFGREYSGNIGHMMHMQGMQGDTTRLETTKEFDKEFLTQMIVHHEMAVMMGKMLEAGTEREEMKILADQIITSQSGEIEMMKSWLTIL